MIGRTARMLPNVPPIRRIYCMIENRTIDNNPYTQTYFIRIVEISACMEMANVYRGTNARHSLEKCFMEKLLHTITKHIGTHPYKYLHVNQPVVLWHRLLRAHCSKVQCAEKKSVTRFVSWSINIDTFDQTIKINGKNVHHRIKLIIGNETKKKR